MKLSKTNRSYLSDIKAILAEARQSAYSVVNFTMVRAYWLVGERIVVEEQNGKERAEYGKQLIKKLARELKKEFGKNFTERRIREIRQFYIIFPFENLWHSPSAETSLAKWHSMSAEFENDTAAIGIVLCSETDQDIARYSILKGNEQIFASKYKLYLPTEEELRAEIEREKLNFKLQFGNKDV